MLKFIPHNVIVLKSIKECISIVKSIKEKKNEKKKKTNEKQKRKNILKNFIKYGIGNLLTYKTM